MRAFTRQPPLPDHHSLNAWGFLLSRGVPSTGCSSFLSGDVSVVSLPCPAGRLLWSGVISGSVSASVMSLHFYTVGAPEHAGNCNPGKLRLAQASRREKRFSFQMKTKQFKAQREKKSKYQLKRNPSTS